MNKPVHWWLVLRPSTIYALEFFTVTNTRNPTAYRHAFVLVAGHLAE